MFTFQQAYDHLNSNSKIWLVTGAAGYVGRQLVKFLLQHNQEVIGVDNFSSSVAKKNINRSSISIELEYHHNHPKYSMHKLYLESTPGEELAHYIQERSIDHVVHLAAKRSVPESYKYPSDVIQSNVNGTIHVYDFAKIRNAKSFVYASSSSVYGENADIYQAEWMSCNPISPYSISKHTAEKIVGTMGVLPTMSVMGLRFFNIYGEEQDGSKKNATVIPKWLRLIRNGEPIEIYGDSAIRRDYVHIEDVIRGIVLASFNSQIAKAEVVNIGSGKSIALHSLIDKMKNTLLSNQFSFPEINVQYKSKFRIGDVSSTHANIDKALDLIGYVPKYNIDTGLQQVVSTLL